MFYLSLRKQKQHNKNNVKGWDVIKVACYTTSSEVRKKWLDKYVSDGYVLISEDVFPNLPKTYDGKLDTMTYWHTDGTMLFAPVSSENTSSVSVETSEVAACSHKYNCRAHREICVKKHGLSEIAK